MSSTPSMKLDLRFTDENNWKYDLNISDDTPRFRLPKFSSTPVPSTKPTPRDRNKFREEQEDENQDQLNLLKLNDIYAYCISQDTESEGPGHKFPRIVLKGVVGQELDTDTSYQRVINEAKWRMSMGHPPEGSEEWRLPNSTLPARPDYSRDPGPAVMSERLTKRDKKKRLTTWESLPELVDSCDLEQRKGLARLSFNLGQLETLPPLLAASMLHEDMKRKTNRTYVPFVASAPVHGKSMTATEVREPHHHIPGFCSGCVRHELCYGCAKESFRPHYHADKPNRTGGGYTYYKRDKPLDEITRKNPANWKETYEPSGLVFYDDFIDFEKYALRMKIGQMHIFERPQYRKLLEDFMKRHQPKMARMGTSNETTMPKEAFITLQNQDVYKKQRTNSPQTDMYSDIDSGRGGTVADSQELLYRSDLDLTRQGFTRIQVPPIPITRETPLTEYEVERMETNVNNTENYKEAWLSTVEEEKSKEDFGYYGRDPTNKSFAGNGKKGANQVTFITGLNDVEQQQQMEKRNSTDEKNKLKNGESGITIAQDENSKESLSSTSKKTIKTLMVDMGDVGKAQQEQLSQENTLDGSLYNKEKTDLTLQGEASMDETRKTPSPVKSSKLPTVAKSPFSTNRELSIPRGDGFSPKKSTKELTKFEDFEHLDRTWNEPDKYEITHPDRKPLEPWQAQRTSPSKMDREVSKSQTPEKDGTPHSDKPEEKPRPGSADSGVESQPPTGRNEQQNESEVAKYHSTLETVPHTPSSGQRSRLSKRSDTTLRVDGEGTFISRSESAVKRQKSESERGATTPPKEDDVINREISSADGDQQVVVQKSATPPDIPETVESKEPTQIEEESQEEEEVTEPQGEMVVEDSFQAEEIEMMEKLLEAEEQQIVKEEEEAAPKPPELDWSKFKKGGIHYAEEEEEEKKKKAAAAKVAPQKHDKERAKLKSRDTAKSQKTDKTSDKSKPTKEKKKKEIVKKEAKKDRKRVKKKPKEKVKKTGKTVTKEESDSDSQGDEGDEEPEPEEEEEDYGLAPIKEYVPKQREAPPSREVEPPPLPELKPPSPPDLPDYANPEKPSREVSKSLIEAPPPMPEPPKQRRPADLKRVPKRKRDRKRVLPTDSVAPVTKSQLKEITDPLDYLAKFCIIHPDRLPHYERVFNTIIKEQVYRYNDVPHPEGFAVPEPVGKTPTSESPSKSASPTKMVSPTSQQKTEITPHERKMIDDLSVITRATRPEYGIAGMNPGDQLVAKLNYTLDTLIDKYENLSDKLDDLEATRVSKLAKLAKQAFPGIGDPDYIPSGQRKKKKKKAKKADKATGEMETQTEEIQQQTDPEEDKQTHGRGVSDMDIVNRLDPKMLGQISKDGDVISQNIEIRRLQEKLKEVDDRIEDLEDEKKIYQLYSRDRFQEDQHAKVKSKQFTRKQSALYNKMHPPQDAEMNLTELEEALQQLNSHLISEKEMQYIYHVLDIPGRKRINVQLFSVIAALSEKVAQVDPLIKKLINKFDFEALDIKMDRSKELFDLLDEDDFDIPDGMIKAKNLVVELAAGGLAPENTAYVEAKFNREKKGIVDYLDFLTYLPLFIEIHERIIAHPLNGEREL